MDEVFRALRAQCLCASWRFGRLSLLSSSVRRPCRQRLKPGADRDRGGGIKQLTENRMPLHPRCCRFKESRKNKTADRPSKAGPLLTTILPHSPGRSGRRMAPESGAAATGSEPGAGYDTNRRASPLHPHRRSESGIIPQGMALLTERAATSRTHAAL